MGKVSARQADFVIEGSVDPTELRRDEGRSATTPAVVTLALRATLVLQGSGATSNWTGGVPPYRLQRATDLTLGDWTDVLTNAVSPVTLTLERQAEFYRIVGQ